MNNKDKRSQIIFVVLTIFYSFIMFVLFYRQCVEYQGLYLSDMKAYIREMLGTETTYDFPYPVFFKFAGFLHFFTGPELAVALATMLLNSLGIVITKLAFATEELYQRSLSLKKEKAKV